MASVLLLTLKEKALDAQVVEAVSEPESSTEKPVVHDPEIVKLLPFE